MKHAITAPALYAIVDTKTNEILQGLLSLHRHPASAIRMFSDIASQERGPLAQHVEDYHLIEYGYLEEQDPDQGINRLVTTHDVILTGTAWLASTQPEPKKQLELLEDSK